MSSYDGQVFEKMNFSTLSIQNGEFEKCSFQSCNFSNSDLSRFQFSDCVFEGCQISSVKNSGMSLNNVTFRHCKILGVFFEECNDLLFSVSFIDCVLDYSTFVKMSLKGMSFKNSILREVDFSMANLAGSSFFNCDLQGAIFRKTNLENVDFRTSRNYSFSPEENRIKKAKFTFPMVLGLLNRYDIEIE